VAGDREQPGDQSRQTKPISRLRISDCGFGTDLPPRARASRSCKTKPNLGRMGYLGDGPWEQHIVQNEANFSGRPGRRKAKCAKRSQFGQRCHPNTLCRFASSLLPAGSGLTGSGGGYRLIRRRGSALGDTCNRNGKEKSWARAFSRGPSCSRS
jgi:hypothetical protein